MAIPGLLVEYLISGALALVWAYPLLKRTGLDALPASYWPFIVLGLYLLGMAVDFYAFILLRPIKYHVRGITEKRYGIAKGKVSGKTASRNAKFWIYAPEVAKEVAMRSSRDRIARGMIINSILATIFILPASLGFPLILTSFAMWMFFEYSSYSFELKAEQALDKKIQDTKASS